MTYRPALISLALFALAGVAHAQAPNLPSLHDALHLSTAQEDAWRAYRGAITPDPQAEARRRSAAMMMSTLTTPRRVDLINAEMEQELTTVRRQGEAVKAFYATLTPDQQRTFDRQTLQSGQPGAPGGSSLRQPSQGRPLPPPN